MSEQAVSDAIRGAISAALPTWATAYEVGSVPTTLPSNYVEVSVSRRYIDDGARADGAIGTLSYRVSTFVVAQMKVNAQTLVASVTGALDFTTLAVGEDSTTVMFETGDPAALDKDRYSAMHTWTCNLPTLSK